MGKIIIGCWDCQYCGTTRISGELRECPGCGRSRDKDVQFYMADPNNYAKDQDSANREADWVCPYCDCLNPASANTCSSCGANRDGKTKDYFQNREKQEQKHAAEDHIDYEEAVQQQSAGQQQSAVPAKKPRAFLILAIIAAVIALVVFLVYPKKKDIEIVSCNWERSVEVQLYKEFEESGWDLPAGAYDVSTRMEIHGYESVFDHYETRTRQVSEEVIDHYDSYYTYNDLGNGNFEEIEHQRPVYRTEYHTETYQEPVYRQEPIYATKYYYLIMRWVTDHYEKTSGENDEPYFAKISVSSTCREGTRSESYWIIDAKGDRYSADYEIWKDLKAGQQINAKIQFKHIKEVLP